VEEEGRADDVVAQLSNDGNYDNRHRPHTRRKKRSPNEGEFEQPRATQEEKVLSGNTEEREATPAKMSSPTEKEQASNDGMSDDGTGDENMGDEGTGDEHMGDEGTGDEHMGDEHMGDEGTGDEHMGD